jgi:hypothetical protein
MVDFAQGDLVGASGKPPVSVFGGIHVASEWAAEAVGLAGAGSAFRSTIDGGLNLSGSSWSACGIAPLIHSR